MAKNKKALDKIDWKIVTALQEDGRVSTAELARKTALSAPAVAERIQKLRDRGVIRGFHAMVDPAAVGLPVTAMIRMSVVGDILPRLAILLQSLPEEYRLPLTLRYITGADYETIETQLGLSNGSLRGLLHRGLKVLRSRLEGLNGERIV